MKKNPEIRADETMSHEIEAKIKVPELEPVEARLKTLDAEPLRDIRQVDTYFVDQHKLLHKNDCGLRIRQEFADGRQIAMVTFKGPRSVGKYKSRPEFETGIGDADVMKKIFESLGYTQRITLEKKRAVWRLDACHVCLDDVPPLGFFVEVEGPDDAAIFGVLEKLDLQEEPHISSGYASMMAKELKREETQKSASHHRNCS